MQPRTTALLALIACLLGAFVYFYEIAGEADREADLESAKRLFPGVDSEDIDALELTTTDGRAARFERRDGRWQIVSPIEGAGDGVALDAIAGALSQLVRAGSVKTAPGDLAQFGLGDAAQVVRFEVEGSGHALRVGKATPVGANVYVSAEESAERAPDVAYVESFRLNAWKRSLDELRERRIVDLEAGDVERLAVSWPEEGGVFEMVLVRGPENVWQIEKPMAARADQEMVGTLLSNLAYLQASGFVDERTPEVDAALLETAIGLRWTTAAGVGESEGERKPQSKREGSMRIAGLLDGERLVEGEGGALRRIAAERLEDFPRRLTAYRDKTLTRLDAASLERIELEFPSPESAEAGSVVLVQKDGIWSGDGRELDPEAVAALAAMLASLRASDIVADAMGEAELASLGLAPPAVRVRLVSASSGATQDATEGTHEGTSGATALELGRLDPERGLFVRRNEDATVFVLSAETAQPLPLTLADVDARLAKPAAEAEAENQSAVPAAVESDAAAPSDLLEQ